MLLHLNLCATLLTHLQSKRETYAYVMNPSNTRFSSWTYRLFLNRILINYVNSNYISKSSKNSTCWSIPIMFWTSLIFEPLEPINAPMMLAGYSKVAPISSSCHEATRQTAKQTHLSCHVTQVTQSQPPLFHFVGSTRNACGETR